MTRASLATNLPSTPLTRRSCLTPTSPTTIASRFFRLKLLVFRLTSVTNAWPSRALSFRIFMWTPTKFGRLCSCLEGYRLFFVAFFGSVFPSPSATRCLADISLLRSFSARALCRSGGQRNRVVSVRGKRFHNGSHRLRRGILLPQQCTFNELSWLLPLHAYALVDEDFQFQWL